jgi:hypothetical protein
MEGELFENNFPMEECGLAFILDCGFTVPEILLVRKKEDGEKDNRRWGRKRKLKVRKKMEGEEDIQRKERREEENHGKQGSLIPNQHFPYRNGTCFYIS